MSVTGEPAATGRDRPADVSPLEAFIGSGDSGDPTSASRDTAELRAEATVRRRVG